MTDPVHGFFSNVLEFEQVVFEGNRKCKEVKDNILECRRQMNSEKQIISSDKDKIFMLEQNVVATQTYF